MTCTICIYCVCLPPGSRPGGKDVRIRALNNIVQTSSFTDRCCVRDKIGLGGGDRQPDQRRDASEFRSCGFRHGQARVSWLRWPDSVSGLYSSRYTSGILTLKMIPALPLAQEQRSIFPEVRMFCSIPPAFVQALALKIPGRICPV